MIGKVKCLIYTLSLTIDTIHLRLESGRSIGLPSNKLLD